MKIALVYSSKAGMASSLSRETPDAQRDEEDEPPLDFFAECDSDETIQAVRDALSLRHEVVPVESDEQAYERLKAARPDLVFNIAERLIGPNRESHIPDDLRGPRPALHGLGPDDARHLPRQVAGQGDPVLPRRPQPRVLGRRPCAAVPAAVRLPAIVKPLFEGSSKGIKDNSVVDTRAELEARVAEVTATYKQPVIIERFLRGWSSRSASWATPPDSRSCPSSRSTTACSPTGRARSIPTRPSGSGTRRTSRSRSSSARPGSRPPSPPGCRRRPPRPARSCASRTGAGSMSGSTRDGEPNILEVNPLPGILPKPEDNSCLPKAARTAGYSYNDAHPPRRRRGPARYGLRPVPEPAADRRRSLPMAKSKNKHRRRHRLQRLRSRSTGRKVERLSEESVAEDGQRGPDRGHRSRLHGHSSFPSTRAS